VSAGTGRPTRDGGSAAIWVLACCVLVSLVAGAAVLRGVAVLARHRAESVADLAALAAAGQIGVSAHSCAAARRIAAESGAAVRRCALRVAPDGRSGTVAVTIQMTVRLLQGRAWPLDVTARAARLPS
jgi:secretion/DNA translocation related TadE-like protein